MGPHSSGRQRKCKTYAYQAVVSAKSIGRRTRNSHRPAVLARGAKLDPFQVAHGQTEVRAVHATQDPDGRRFRMAGGIDDSFQRQENPSRRGVRSSVSAQPVDRVSLDPNCQPSLAPIHLLSVSRSVDMLNRETLGCGDHEEGYRSLRLGGKYLSEIA